jgi:phage protein D/phage baseplate assembly protein gpV
MPRDTSREHVPTYAILVDGGELSQEHRDRIKEIRVVDHLRLPDVCTVSVQFPKAEGIDSQPFEIGKKLEVRLGAREKEAPETLFKGDVVSLEPVFGAGGCSLTVNAYDRAHLLNRSRKVRVFQNQTATDIVKKIVSEAGLSFEGESSGEPYEFMQQDNETDWDFIWRLAERCGFEFVVDDTKAYFRKPGHGGTVELEWPKSLSTFRPRMTAVQQVSTVSVFAHDPKTKQAIQAEAGQPEQIAQIGIERTEVAGAFAEAKMHVATEPVKSSAEGSTLAQALLDKLANGYIAAEGAGPGNPRVKAGVMVNVKGVGTSFSGIYRVATSTHVLRGGSSYVMQFANSPSHTILGAVGAAGPAQPAFAAQLVLGVVTNTNDPEDMGRVRVNYPALSGDTEGAWARIATMSAGKERGALMLPVVGEEVLVGFEHGDTTRPYVLGSLFNGQDTPGDLLLHDKDGSFVVRSDTEVYSESKKAYTIKSGGPLTVTIADKVDEKFDRDWTNKTNGKTTLTAVQPFSIEGQSVSVKGKTEVTLEGTVSLTLKCGGSQIQLSPAGVTISGPLINIG